MKFAYLILAHNNFLVLGKLVEMLDDPRNDIYIHFDRKLKELPEIRTKSSGLFIIQDRVDVRWGTTSQIKAIYKLFRSAYHNNTYEFFFLISGTHLPLKDQDYIHEYFAKYKGNTVIRKWNFTKAEVDFKLRRYHFLIDNFQNPNKFLRYIVQFFWRASMFIQKHLNITANPGNIFVKADEWAVISAPHIRHMLDIEKDILKKYRHTFCSDEFYLASELLAFDAEHVLDDQHLLFMHFDADRPLEIDKSEHLRLKKSPYIFARKFSDNSI